MGRMRIRHIAAAAVLAAAVIALTTCSNPIDLVEAATVEVMKANDRYLEVVDFGPANNATNISPSTSIWIEFDRDLDESTVTPANIDITPAVPWMFDFNSASNTLTIQPTLPGDAVTTYTVTLNVGLKGADGRDLLAGRSWSFEVKQGPSGSVSINGGSAYSISTTTNTLNFSVNTVAQWYRYSLDSATLSSATWIDIPSYPTFNVTNVTLPIQGTNTVYVQFWDNGTEFSNLASPIADSIVVDSVAPNAPTVSGTTPTTLLRPTWTWSSGGGGGNSNYRYNIDGGAWSLPTTTTTFTPGSDLAYGTRTLNVQERDAAGNWSPSGSKAIGIITGAPTNVVAADNASTASVTVSWTGSTGATEYSVERATSATGTYANVGTVLAPTTTYSDTTATPGTVYYYKVRAYAAGLYSAYSGYDAGYRKLATPGSVSATDATSTSQVTITWGAVTGAALYYIDRSTSSTGTYVNIGSTSGITYNDTTGSSGAVYYYKVRAYSAGYYSDYSSYDSGVKQLATPTSVLATDGDVSTGITVSWTTVTGAASYYIYRSTTSTGTYSLVASGVTGGTWTDTGVTLYDQYYFYKVAAQANGYFSALSDYNQGHRGLPAPTSVSATDGQGNGEGVNSVRITWLAVTDATGYMVYRSATYNGTYTYQGSTTNLYYDNYPPAYNTTYYYKVRAYRTNTGYPGIYSSYNGGWYWNINSSTELSGWWRFDTTNLWNDTGSGNSSYDHFTTFASDPASTTTRLIGTGAAEFDGNDMATSTDYTFMSTDRKSVSVAFWMVPWTTYASTNFFMMCNDFGISQSGGTSPVVNFSISVPSTNSASVSVSTATWAHIVGTYDGATIRIYKNGSLVTSKAHAGTVSTPSTNRYLTVGGWSAGSWYGIVDDLRIYNRVLTDSEIYALYRWRDN